jgi:ATP-dependent phosphofructokinase / diphosphate-dependent phosphofructokinase
MGRKSGALALGMCKSAGATLAVIPEEFHADPFDLNMVVDTIVGAIVKRRAWGRDDGVALVAEGIAERLEPGALERLAESGRDAYGHVHLSDVPIGSVLREQISKALTEVGVKATVVSKDIGYELRCAKPLPFDVEYTRTLGYGAVRYLLSGGSGALIAISGGRVTPVSLNDLKDPETGRVRTRMVEIDTESYHVARSYMIRLEMHDFEEPALSSMAAQTKLTPARFKERFLPVVKATAPGPGDTSAVSTI